MERTDIDGLLARLEEELRRDGRVSPDPLRSGARLPAALRPVLAFLGAPTAGTGEPGAGDPDPDRPDPEDPDPDDTNPDGPGPDGPGPDGPGPDGPGPDGPGPDGPGPDDTAPGDPAPPLPRHVRLALARLTLLRLAVHTGHPRGPAARLATAFALAAGLPGGEVDDIPDALSTLLLEPPLTQDLADFLGEVAELWMRRYPQEYARHDFALLTSRLVRSGTPALACFAALSLPPEQLRRHRAHILRALPRGPHRYTAVSLIETRAR